MYRVIRIDFASAKRGLLVDLKIRPFPQWGNPLDQTLSVLTRVVAHFPRAARLSQWPSTGSSVDDIQPSILDLSMREWKIGP
jgi:hypothetical protein